MKRCEKGNHKWTHGYHVCENLEYSYKLILIGSKVFPFVEGWSANEELRMMEGMQEFRFGNWE